MLVSSCASPTSRRRKSCKQVGGFQGGLLGIYFSFVMYFRRIKAFYTRTVNVTVFFSHRLKMGSVKPYDAVYK